MANVPTFAPLMKKKIAVAPGDGIGPEIMDAVLGIFEAAQVPLEYEKVDMGKDWFEKGFSAGMTPEAKDKIEDLGILFKGPMETPKGKGMKSINVTARKVWSTYANRRHFRTLDGVETVYSKAGIPIDITIVRENIEDTYGGIEHRLTGDVAVCRRFITREGSKQVHRFAFEMAKKEGFTQVTCGHKANIMKITDGLFLETFYEVASEYPEINANDIIVDDLCMKLVVKPHTFQVVVLPNLQGDIVSDLCAGLVGGLGFAPSANIGDRVCIFEAVHGTAPDIAGKQIANPTSLLLSGLMMLRHLGLSSYADTIKKALLVSLEQGNRTADFGSPASSTIEFAQHIISCFGKEPSQPLSRASQEGELWKPLPKPAHPPMLKGALQPERRTTGMDLFVESDLHPNALAEKIQSLLPQDVKIVMVSNRGTQVWPQGSLLTECVNHYRVRIEFPANDTRIWEFPSKVHAVFPVTSTELLCEFDGKPGYSLAQGQ